MYICWPIGDAAGQYAASKLVSLSHIPALSKTLFVNAEFFHVTEEMRFAADYTICPSRTVRGLPPLARPTLAFWHGRSPPVISISDIGIGITHWLSLSHRMSLGCRWHPPHWFLWAAGGATTGF